MQNEKKLFILKRFRTYMGKRWGLLPIALFLSGLSAILNILPFVLVWFIARGLLDQTISMEAKQISWYAWLAFMFAVTGVIVYFLSLMSSHLAAFRVEVGIQKQGMEKIVSKPLGFYDQNSSGKIRKIVNDGAATVHTFLAHQLPDIAGSVVSPIILLVLIFVMDWRMGLASIIPIMLGFSTMAFMMGKQGRTFQKRYLDALEEMSSESVEYIRGIPVVKTFGQSVFSFKRFYNSIINYKEMVYAYTLLWKRPMSFYTVIMQSSVFFLIPTALFLIGRGENLAVVLADYIFYLMISPIFTGLLMKSMYFRQNMVIAEQAIDRLDHLLDYPNLSVEDECTSFSQYSLEFKNVSFSYPGSKQNAVNDISFKIEAGETVALVGASGGGKTTIARLASRFWDADTGEILMGGINIKKIPQKELMDKIALVFQNTKLFKSTLRENIVFGKKYVKDQEIERAIDLSQSREIIDHLPNGLETEIGTKGTYLSGGEQQRITIARAFLKDAPIVVMDEATAFADPENEHLIQAALSALSHGKTTLLIAHRLTTVVKADRILVVDQGQISEVGTHQELLNKGGSYKKMWNEYQQSVAWKIGSVEEKSGGHDAQYIFSK
ncbi:MAG: ATP-binding cassette, subfamily bacterial IrtA/YbtP [Eubacteriaceae bacterium]|nr:ATP-binding cassette, subfamily bacterial IrtA/YbtP [Eubacteriaceae bacterium]